MNGERIWKEILVYCRKSRTWTDVSFANSAREIDIVNGFMNGHGGGIHGLAMCPDSYCRINARMRLKVREREGKQIIKEYPIKKSDLPALLAEKKRQSDEYLAALEKQGLR